MVASGGIAGTEVTVAVLVNAGLVLLAAYLLAKAVNVSLTVLADRLATQRFRVTLLIPVAKFAVYGIGIYVVVRLLFEFSTTQLVAFSGLLGAALGLGLKDLLADVVGGLILVAEQPYRIGDKIRIGDHYGEVTDIGIRSTVLETPDDDLVAVPNFLFVSESTANASGGNAEMLVVVEFFVDPAADVGRARQIVEDALYTSQYVYVTDGLPVTVLVEDNLYYRTIRGKAYVTDLREEFTFKSDVTARVLDAFDDEGIRSPQVPAGVGGETPEEV
ncbi:MAG: mechanosensitive ion channel domain-containing protein [Haloarculaceae archaeon]|jgi:small-conductance mechanosensitive channel